MTGPAVPAPPPPPPPPPLPGPAHPATGSPAPAAGSGSAAGRTAGRGCGWRRVGGAVAAGRTGAWSGGRSRSRALGAALTEERAFLFSVAAVSALVRASGARDSLCANLPHAPERRPEPALANTSAACGPRPPGPRCYRAFSPAPAFPALFVEDQVARGAPLLALHARPSTGA